MSNDNPNPRPVPSPERSSSAVRTVLYYLIYAALLVAAWFLWPIVLDRWRGSDGWAWAIWIAYVAIMIGILWLLRQSSLERWEQASVERRGLVMPSWARRMLPICEISVAAGLGVLATVHVDTSGELWFVHVTALLTCIVMGVLGWFIKWWAELDRWKPKGGA